MGSERFELLGRKLRALYKAEAPETQEAPAWWKAAVRDVQTKPVMKRTAVVPVHPYVSGLAAMLALALVSVALVMALVPDASGGDVDWFAYAPLTAPSSGQAVPVVPLAIAMLLPVALLGCLLVPRFRPAVPWFGLLTVNGTALAFLAFAGIAAYHGLPPVLGWLMTGVYGLAGLTVVVGSVGLGPARYMPVGAGAAGLIYLASFYALLAAWGWDMRMLALLLPGFTLAGFGALLSRRYGLTARGQSATMLTDGSSSRR